MTQKNKNKLVNLSIITVIVIILIVIYRNAKHGSDQRKGWFNRVKDLYKHFDEQSKSIETDDLNSEWAVSWINKQFTDNSTMTYPELIARVARSQYKEANIIQKMFLPKEWKNATAELYKNDEDNDEDNGLNSQSG